MAHSLHAFVHIITDNLSSDVMYHYLSTPPTRYVPSEKRTAVRVNQSSVLVYGTKCMYWVKKEYQVSEADDCGRSEFSIHAFHLSLYISV